MRRRKEKYIRERCLQHPVGAESGTLAEAKERLGHASESTTRKFYPVKAVRITPLVTEINWNPRKSLELGKTPASIHLSIIAFQYAPVAQLDRVPGFEPANLSVLTLCYL